MTSDAVAEPTPEPPVNSGDASRANEGGGADAAGGAKPSKRPRLDWEQREGRSAGTARAAGGGAEDVGGEQPERGNEDSAAGGDSDACLDVWESGTDGDNSEEDSDYSPDDDSDGDGDVNPVEDEVTGEGGDAGPRDKGKGKSRAQEGGSSSTRG